MRWKPEPYTGLWVGLGVILFLVLVDVGLVWRVIHGPINGITFVCSLLALLSIPAMALIGYRMYDLSQLQYEFDRNRLVISTAAARQIIPMGRVQQVIDGRSANLEVGMRTLTWPGYCIGRGHVQGLGLTLFYADVPPSRQAIVVTPTLAYGISVPDIEAFMEVFGACRQMGSSVEVKQESRQSAYVHWAIWGDRLAHGVLVGSVVLNLALFAILCFRYPRLPNLVPMHYDIQGRVDRISPRGEIFVLPVIGLIILAANSVLGGVLYRRERIVSYITWSGALLVQILFLLALLNIVR